MISNFFVHNYKSRMTKPGTLEDPGVIAIYVGLALLITQGKSR